MDCHEALVRKVTKRYSKNTHRGTHNVNKANHKLELSILWKRSFLFHNSAELALLEPKIRCGIVLMDLIAIKCCVPSYIRNAD